MYIFSKPEQRGLGEFGWFVHPAGHKDLTLDAEKGLVNQAELATLIDGVSRPDTTSWWYHFFPDQMKRHFLRSAPSQDFHAARDEALNHLRNLHKQILFFRYNPNNPGEQFRLIGEALHLIQDSYSPAHVKRERGTGRILDIRSYPSRGHFPVDPRDSIYGVGGLRNEASGAIVASREFLNLVLRHIKQPKTVSHLYFYQELDYFICRYFSITGGRCPAPQFRMLHRVLQRPRPTATPTPGQYYQIKRGDTLWAIAGKAYGGKTGLKRLAFVKMINNHPDNRKFWRAAPAAERKWFPSGRISFNPIFACDPNAQLRAKGKAPAGRCYAMIYIPRR